MDASPARKKGPRPRRGRLQSGEASHQCERRTRKISKAHRNGKSKRRPTLADAHLSGYLRFLSRELRGRDADITGRKFLSEAKRRYKQFLRSGDLDLRRLTWSAIQLCARQLEKEAS